MHTKALSHPGKHVVPESSEYSVGRYVPELNGYMLHHTERFEWNVWLIGEKKIQGNWHEDWYNIGDLLRSLGFKDAHDQKECTF